MAKQDYMIRKYAGIEFQQERKTGMINITPLFNNSVQLLEMLDKKANTGIPVLANDNKNKRLDNYMNEPATKALLKRLAEVEGLTPKEVKRASRAKNAEGTFVHPVIFVNAMRYISLDFEIWANKLVMDDLIKYRNMTAQSNKEIAKAFDEGGLITDPSYQYGTLNIAIGDACDCAFEQRGLNRHFLWEYATKEQLRKREKIQTTISSMILMGNITSFGEGITAIKVLGNKLN